jgi:hypothetical protein
MGKNTLIVGLGSSGRKRGRPRKYDKMGNPITENTPQGFIAVRRRSPSPSIGRRNGKYISRGNGNGRPMRLEIELEKIESKSRGSSSVSPPKGNKRE